MPGTPRKQMAQDWLLANPRGTARELQEALGCSASWAGQQVRRWRALNNPNSPGPKGWQVVRVPVEDLPAETRQAVIDEIRQMMHVITLTNARIIHHHGEFRPAELNQMASAVNQMTRSIQTLTDTYPGLGKLIAESELDEGGGDALDDDVAAADEWLLELNE